MMVETIQDGLRAEPSSSIYAVPPLQWDKERDEPFLEVEHRGEKYLLTMWRESDEDDMVRRLSFSVHPIPVW